MVFNQKFRIVSTEMCRLLFQLTLFWVTVVSASESEIFDFIIVGGGSAGCVIASRLAKDGKFTVALVEAGDVPREDMEIPAEATKYLTQPNEFVKLYNTVRQENAALSYNGIVSYPTGRVLGGSGMVNGMMFNRGSPLDYDNWANITGNDNWNYPNMLKYFKMLENYKGEFPSDQHGYHGPIVISRPEYSPGLDLWLEAGKSLGYPVADQNGPQIISFTPVEFNKDMGRRSSSYSAYLKPLIETKSNLKVFTNSEVFRIEVDKNRAVGVTFTSYQTGVAQNLTLKAYKEIIISAGIIGSPMLLMKSGIGPSDILEEAQIPVVKDLPVGKTLEDHVAIKLDFIINNTQVVFDAERDLTPENFELFKESGNGPYTTYSGVVGQGFFALDSERGDWPNIQMVGISNPGVPGLFTSTVNASELEEYEAVTSCLVYLGRPKSQGTLRLNTTNVNSSPLIDFQYFSDPEDIRTLLKGIRLAIKVYETGPYQSVAARLSSTPLEPCRHHAFSSDEYWTCYMRQLTVTGVHATGTCRMGRGPEDTDAVVDSNLRVIGMQGLRVADASVIPKITNSNIQAAVLGLGLRVSDAILNEYEK